MYAEYVILVVISLICWLFHTIQDGGRVTSQEYFVCLLHDTSTWFLSWEVVQGEWWGGSRGSRAEGEEDGEERVAGRGGAHCPAGRWRRHWICLFHLQENNCQLAERWLFIIVGDAEVEKYLFVDTTVKVLSLEELSKTTS